MELRNARRSRFARHAAVAMALLLVLTVFDFFAASGRSQETPTPPKDKVGLILNTPKAFQGYTLFSPLSSFKTYLIDMEGRVVHSWEGAATPASSAYLLENGNLLRPCLLVEKKQPSVSAKVGPKGGRVQEFTWDGELVWDYKLTTDTIVPHHDVARMPNGNVMVIAWDKKTPEEVAAAGRRGGGKLDPDCLFEIKPTGKTTGEVVWEWHVWDHLIQDHDKTKANFGDVAAHPELIDVNLGLGKGPQFGDKKEVDKLKGIGYLGGGPGRVDWNHINCVVYDAELDQIMLSVHEFSEFWIIDHSTTTAEAASHKGGRSGKGGDLLYRWGNPATYRAGTAADQQLFAQHHTHWIPKGLPGAGHALVFNNGNGRRDGTYSSVDEVVLPVDAQGRYAHQTGSAYGPEKAIWSYTAPDKKDFYSSYISGAQRLPNGNTLICQGADGTIFEVTPEKEIVWKYINPVKSALGGGAPPPKGKGPMGAGGAVFRVRRIASDYPALAGKALKPGKTVEELLNDVK